MIYKTIDYFTTPSNLITVLLIIGALLFLLPRLKKVGVSLVSIGIALYFVASNGPTAYFLLGTLEHRFPPLKHLLPGADYKSIAVLAGYGASDDYLPPSSMLNEASLYRTVEAARIWYQMPSTIILLAGPEGATSAMQNVLKALQIPDEAVTRLPASQNTRGNIDSLKPILGNEPFILITSAGHMPRAMRLCRHINLNPTPAPTDFYTSPHPGDADWRPSPFYLRCMDLAVHEYLAILYLTAIEKFSVTQ